MIIGTAAIVGRPNVGKSTIFNRLLGERVSIVDDSPGVTRDRIYGKTEWLTKEFSIIDTGGIQIEQQPFQEEIKAQVAIALEEADTILFVVDGKSGITSDDEYIARMLRKTDKPVFVLVNKIDDYAFIDNTYEFYALGYGEPVAVSAAHGIGIGDVLDKVIESFDNVAKKPKISSISFAVIGQPNVGKSSLVNAILNQERVIVSDIEGTTRDAIDTPFTQDGINYQIIDTAGIRKKGRIYENIEKYSVLRAMMAIERSDVILFLIDGEKGIRDQDKHVAGYAHDAGKPIIIVYNKWDAVDKDTHSINEVTQKIREEFLYLSYAPIIFVSALTKQRIHTILPLVNQVFENSKRRVETSVVNEVIMDAQQMNPPKTKNGKRLKIYYSSQVAVAPPCFVLFVNDIELLHFSYQRYLENRLREAFDFSGTPIKIIARKKS